MYSFNDRYKRFLILKFNDYKNTIQYIEKFKIFYNEIHNIYKKLRFNKKNYIFILYRFK